MVSIISFSQVALPCTTIIVGKELTKDKVIIHAHNEDMGMETVGRLWHVSAKQYSKDATISVPYVTIKQPKKTLSYWASGNSKLTQGLGTSQTQLPYDSILVGMNENGVTMACNWAFSREAKREKKGIRRYAIRQLILERAVSAKAGVELIGKFIDSHGQADHGGLIYVLADSKEAWVVETTTHHWVAKKIRDNEIWVSANRFRIGTTYDLSSKQLVENAKTKGWFDPKKGPFNFSQAYGDPEKMNQKYDKERENRVLELLEIRKGKISEEDLFSVLRDRYDNTKMYTPPQGIELLRDVINNNPNLHRTISTNRTQSSFVALLRENSPFGSVMWFAMATPTSSGYFPIYARGETIPRSFSIDESAISNRSAWWTFRKLQQMTDQKYKSLQPQTSKAFYDQYLKLKKRWHHLERQAEKLLSQGQKEASYSLINRFCSQEADNTWKTAKKLLSDLQTKYQ